MGNKGTQLYRHSMNNTGTWRGSVRFNSYVDVIFFLEKLALFKDIFINVDYSHEQKSLPQRLDVQKFSVGER